MTNLIKYPSTDQFREAIRTIRDRAKYDNLPLPTVKFVGTVKLHGTSAGVVRDIETGETWFQSRERILTLDFDNAGFCAFAMGKTETWDYLFNRYLSIALENGLIPSIDSVKNIALNNEWACGNIQSGVALSQIPEKKLFLFSVRLVMKEGNDVWLPLDKVAIYDEELLKSLNSQRVYVITQFPTYEIEIDFNEPTKVQNDLVALVNQIEAECPVGKFFGVSGIGAGAVFSAQPHETFNVSGVRFKCKGSAHSESKVKTLAEVDPEKIKGIAEFVEYAATDYRLDKIYGKLTEDLSEPPSMRNTGDYIKAVCQDIIKEETDTIVASGIEWKEIAKSITIKARNFFINKIDQQ